MYAAFEHVMMYVWAVYGCVLFGFVVWGAWALLIDEPRKRRRTLKRLASITPKRAVDGRLD